MLGKKTENFVSKRLDLTKPSGSHHYLCASTVLVSKPLLSDWARIRIERASCGLREAPILLLVHNTQISSTIRVHNQSDTNFFSNISFILSGTIVRLHTNKGNMFVNKYATFREYSLHSYFLRDFCFKKLIKNMAVTRNIYTDGMLFDNKYLDQSAPY